MSLTVGESILVTVLRKTDIGYMLTDGASEVFLHNNEVTEEIEDGQEIEVFMYSDHQGRMAATMEIPEASIDNFAWVTVSEVNPDLGIFVDIGISKDMLIHKGDLSPQENVWPQVGDELYCRLKATGQERLIAKLATEQDMREIAVPATESMFNKNVNGIIYRTLRVGSYILTDERFLGFIHDSQRGSVEPRIGQKVTGRIIMVKEDGEINVSMLPRKQEGQADDADKIAEYMASRGGAMPYWDKSNPEDILERFDMSKGAFKRGLGKLLKEGKIYQESGWTYFKEDEEDKE